MNGIREASYHTIVFQSRAGSPELNCCSVNSARGFGLAADWALMRDDEGLALNLYGPSEMSAEVSGGRIRLRQVTDYPRSGRIRVRIEEAPQDALRLKFRIPGWSRDTRAAVNGEPVCGVSPGTYMPLERAWETGDTVDLQMDMSTHFWPGERECAGRTSAYVGPVLLAYDGGQNLGRRDAADADDGHGYPEEFDLGLEVPQIDAKALAEARPEEPDRPGAIMNLTCAARDGGRVRLVDYATAGRGGSPYVSWLPVVGGPERAEPTPGRTLPSSRPT
jgi:hypothetical protein